MNLLSGCKKAVFDPPNGHILDYFKMDQLSTAEISAIFRRNDDFLPFGRKYDHFSAEMSFAAGK